MGDDTPVAVLSSHFRPVSHYFRQNFSQVTNPPIDSLRENKVMSLKTRFGNLGNILDFDNLTEENIYVLDSPILTNSQLKKFKRFFQKKQKKSTVHSIYLLHLKIELKKLERKLKRLLEKEALV